MRHTIASVVNTGRFSLDSPDFRARCKRTLDQNGALVLRNFLTPAAVDTVRREGEQRRHLAYYTASGHNIYLNDPDSDFGPEHARNRLVTSSKGCITTNQIPPESPLHVLYEARDVQAFLCAVLAESALYPYADPLSSINLHYADEGQELGWHFDNSSFAITLMIQNPIGGGRFEYVKNVRDADSGEMNYAKAAQVLDGEIPTKVLTMDAGSLVLFRGRNSMHRVTPTVGDRTRMLVVLAYNTQPGIALSESARMTFYGRLV